MTLAVTLLMSNFTSAAATTNRLAGEKSPYLLQHADNPVNWFAWGDEAFALARQEGRLIFLSIGYSTCHWCHVMAHESFADRAVAALLNRDYVAIKVDREERPDIDQVYMDVCVKLTGSGGWPLTIIMTPEAVPIFAATYIPKDNRYGRLGLLELLPQVAQRWESSAAELRQNGQRLIAGLGHGGPGRDGATFAAELLDRASAQLSAGFDPTHAGFGQAPKFPAPHNLNFLLNRYRRSGDEKLLGIVESSLRQMRRGGIYDQVGFGFHRYATDRAWRVPHFEKMLYDQAGLANLYLTAWQVTGNGSYAETAEEIFSYVERKLTAPEGGFYSAEDADSEGVEGKFYLWTLPELEAVLGKEETQLIGAYFGVRGQGNVAGTQTEEFPAGANILYLPHTASEFTSASGPSVPQLKARVERARQRLFAAREKRIQPHRDDKVITAWNGMMIAALARGAVMLDEPVYRQRAERAADFLLTRLVDRKGRLLRRFRDGDAAIPAFAEDYALLSHACLELYRATFAPAWLARGRDLAQALLDRFRGPDGALYDTADDGETLLFRPRTVHDGATPSANAVALEVFARLYRLTGDRHWEIAAHRLMNALTPEVARYPAGMTQLLQGAALLLEPSREVVVAGEADTAAGAEILKVIKRTYQPETVVLLRSSATVAALTKLAPFVAEMTAADNGPAVYLCEEFTCRQPLFSAAALETALRHPPGAAK